MRTHRQAGRESGPIGVDGAHVDESLSFWFRSADYVHREDEC